MLNASEQKAGRFSRAQIADITRGTKVCVRVRRDPIIALIKRADVLLDRYTTAAINRWVAEQKLPVHERDCAAVYIPDELLNVHWSNGFPFTSEQHIDQQFRLAIAQNRQHIAESKRRLARDKTLFRIEVEQGISSARRALRLLRVHRAPLKKAFRKEKARLLKVQNRVGLIVAQRDKAKAYRALQKVTKQIAGTKPTTIDGALAVARYVESRLWCDKPELFTDEGTCPGNFGQLQRKANNIITAAFAER